MNEELKLGLGVSKVAFWILGILLGIFLILPLLIVVPTSWTSGQLVEFPPHGFSFQWYEQALENSQWTEAFWVSVQVAFFGSIIATVLGTATALGMRRLVRGRGTRVAQSLFILPLAIPYVSYALGLYQLVNKLPSGLNETLLPLILAESVIAMPLVYVVIAGALANVDPKLGRAASTMGARWPTILWRIDLPLLKMAIVAGFIFAFATIFDEATLALFLAPVTDITLAQQLYRSAAETVTPTLSAVSTLITLLAILVLGLGTLFSRRRVGATQGGEA
ncbi:MAG: ABC transporter permease [Actinobacteria bacterium]|nr:ABC transporter permease [Actinomycetota bacterium]